MMVANCFAVNVNEYNQLENELYQFSANSIMKENWCGTISMAFVSKI